MGQATLLALSVALAGCCMEVAQTLSTTSLSSSSYAGDILLPHITNSLTVLLSQPFEFFDLSIPMVQLGLLDVDNPGQTPALRQWIYNHVVATGTDSTENGGTSAQTMIYVGLEDGRFIGYFGPEGVRAYTFRPGSGKPADVDTCPGCPSDMWVPFGNLTAVNDCMAEGTCKDASGGRNVSAACPAAPRQVSGSCTSAACLDAAGVVVAFAPNASSCTNLGGGHTWTVGTCCTATCCDGDIRGYYSTSLAKVGAPIAVNTWKAYDPRARPWYQSAKAKWLSNASVLTGWSAIYEFSSAQTIGVSVVGVAEQNAAFKGVFAVDYELAGLSSVLNASLEYTQLTTTWAYIVERQNGKLLAVTSLADSHLYNRSAPGSFLQQRLNATASQHPSIAASAAVLAAQGWPELLHRRVSGAGEHGSSWEFQSKRYTGPKLQLDWMVVAGQDIACKNDQVWASLAGRCEACTGGTEPVGQHCVVCEPGHAGAGGSCARCPDGTSPNSDRSACVQCADGSAGTGGRCETCGSFSIPTSGFDDCQFWGSSVSLAVTFFGGAGVLFSCATCLWHRYLWHRETQTFLLKRYKKEPGPSIHFSRTAEALFATDTRLGRQVCVKMMAHREQFEAEIRGRFTDGKLLPTDAVISVLCWHTPKGEPGLSSEDGQTEEPEHTKPSDAYPYVLVMDRGERSLHDACAKERIAGIELPKITQACREIAKCLRMLHASQVIHGDLKQRNILRHKQGWTLCDMDAASHQGKPIGSKTSTAYCPPELARAKFAHGTELDCADASFDIWSFGVVVFELCAGQSLFSQDISNDELITHEDKTRLCTWNTVTDAELGPVLSSPSINFGDHFGHDRRRKMFQQLDADGSGFLERSELGDLAGQMGQKLSDKALDTAMSQMDRDGDGLVSYEEYECWYRTEAHGQIVHDAKNLIRWCLQGEPSQRPTIDQVMAHQFLSPAAPVPRARPMKYHAFLSHAQGDASGTANTLFFAYEQLGLHCWIDMRQEDLTIQGMRQGVADSDVFLLILSEKVLSSWFCQQELLCAIEHRKKIQIVLEMEGRFHPFDLDTWQQSKNERQIKVVGEDTPRPVKVHMDAKHPWQASMEGGDAALTELLCAAVDDNLPQAVAYRRREFEQQAMMRELCLRSGIYLPQHDEDNPHASGGGRSQRSTRLQEVITVLVIHNPATAARMLHELAEGFERFAPRCVRLVLSGDATEAERATADKVLVLLSEGVLARPALVKSLEHTLRADKEQDLERICIVYDEDTWSFGCSAQQDSSDAIRKCLESHEALTFRPQDSMGGFLRHEFPAMVKRLLRIMHVPVAQRVEAKAAGVEEAIPPDRVPMLG